MYCTVATIEVDYRTGRFFVPPISKGWLISCPYWAGVYTEETSAPATPAKIGTVHWNVLTLPLTFPYPSPPLQSSDAQKEPLQDSFGFSQWWLVTAFFSTSPEMVFLLSESFMADQILYGIRGSGHPQTGGGGSRKFGSFTKKVDKKYLVKKISRLIYAEFSWKKPNKGTNWIL